MPPAKQNARRCRLSQNHLHVGRIVQTLHQQFGASDSLSATRDGMDVCLIILHPVDEKGMRTVEFAGAGRPLWHHNGAEMVEYKSARYACGGSQHQEKDYPTHRLELAAGGRLYLFSDGVTDQFGGPKARKLGSTALRKFLNLTADRPISEQGEAFALYFNEWMSERKQLDDVLLVGIAV